VFAVVAGQLALGELLVKGMYGQPDVSSCSQEQLLQLLLLADRYGVPKMLAAVSAAFASIPTEYLQWETVHAIYALPPGCVDMDFCKGLFQATGNRLQHALGDLELIWADRSNSQQQLLTSLPLEALLQLLQDPRTRVASENTVFYSTQSASGGMSRRSSGQHICGQRCGARQKPSSCCSSCVSR
jgi:hypothetical protein